MADTYKISGHKILTPTGFRWQPRKPIDVQGDNRPIYGGVRSAELKWQLTSYSDWSDIQYMYNLVKASGSHVVEIPAFPTISGSSYAFREYSGVHLAEPVIGEFFCEYPSTVVLLIGNIPAD